MSSKRFNTLNVLLVSLSVVAVAYVIRTPWLPIKRETKASLGYPKDSLMNFTELTGKYGYISEEHHVITDDGYILTMFRIVKATNCHKQKRSPPVLLMHGLLQSSDSWIDSGPNAGLAYLISDACYDLWLGNVRGNYYSRGHVHLNPDKDAAYWKFYIEEIGIYDVPAMIDYVLDYTGFEKLNYIGFSQGTGTFLVMCSERPGYCDKAQLVIALAPAARNLNTKSMIFRTLTQTFAKIEGALSMYGVQEVFSKGAFSQEFVAFFCQLSDFTERLCETIIDTFDHADFSHMGSITNETTRVLFGHFPAGTSVHNMARYGQSTRSTTFKKFDYGKEQNLVVYGSEQPPLYNLSATTVPVLCIYGNNDGLVDTKDVEWLMSKLPNVLESVKVKDPLWNHLDVTYSQYTVGSIFPKINEYLLKYTSA
uniref:Lipase n=1 Tax=Agrotis segetum TaxID=47767 RepID=A0A088ML86_AGRSE|nr:fatty alcohol acetyltransferase [Agrotis segetum]